MQRLLRLLYLVLQPLDTILCLGQRVFLHERELRNAIARFRVFLQKLPDQGIRVAVHRRERRLRRRNRAAANALRAGLTADPCDKLADYIAFFVCHACPLR